MANYIFDTNCFIEPHRKFYPIDVAPSFWRKIKRLADSNTIASIDKVYDELFKNNDTLTSWISNNLSASFFKDTNGDEVLTNYRKVVQWANGKSDQYLQKAIDEFLEYERADAWLVAYGMTTDCTIITYEVSAPESKNSIKLPDVCIQFNVSWMNTIEMMRELNERF